MDRPEAPMGATPLGEVGRNLSAGVVPAFRSVRFLSKADFASSKFVALSATRRGALRPFLSLIWGSVENLPILIRSLGIFRLRESRTA